MEIKSEQLSQYISAVIQSVKSGVSSEAYTFEDSIEFALAVSSSTESEGGLNIYVANAEGKT
jgi:hypothetical protein